MTNENWKTEGLPVVKIGDKLTVVLPNGQPKTVSNNDKYYADVIQAISDKNWEILPDLLDPKTAIHNFSDGNFSVQDGLVYIGNEAVPDALSKKIIEFSQSKLPYEPLVKFWEKLKKNPSYRAVQGLYDFLLTHNYPITPSGNFIAYKGVRDNWTDQYTGTISNEIGKTVSMPRNKVDENPEHTCHPGLHVANFEYARDSYGTGIGGRLIMVEVNPEYVVSVPSAYACAKMRVCEYTVLSEVGKLEAKVTGGLYNSASDDLGDDNGLFDEEDEYCEECDETIGFCECD